MSRPNDNDDSTAPLLVGDEEPSLSPAQSRERTITIMNRIFSLPHLGLVAVGILALIALGVSIAAIGK